jgi:hypothetical protein
LCRKAVFEEKPLTAEIAEKIKEIAEKIVVDFEFLCELCETSAISAVKGF